MSLQLILTIQVGRVEDVRKPHDFKIKGKLMIKTEVWEQWGLNAPAVSCPISSATA